MHVGGKLDHVRADKGKSHNHRVAVAHSELGFEQHRGVAQAAVLPAGGPPGAPGTPARREGGKGTPGEKWAGEGRCV